MRLLLLSIAFNCFFSVSQAQEELKTVQQKGKGLKIVELYVQPNVVYTNLDPDFTFKTATVEFLSNKLTEKSYIFLGDKEKFSIALQEADSLKQVSTAMIAKLSNRYFSFFSGKYEGWVRFRLTK